MAPLDASLTYGTAGVGLGGAFLAQATQSPEVTTGALVLAAIGLASLWVRSHYSLKAAQLDSARIKTELEIYRRLCSQEHRCPYSPDGEPACTMAVNVDAETNARELVPCPEKCQPSEQSGRYCPGRRHAGSRRGSTPFAPGVERIDGPGSAS
jgi:hypothetical protein